MAPEGICEAGRHLVGNKLVGNKGK